MACPGPSRRGEKVMLALDSSPSSEAAFNWYVEHAHKKRHQILVLHVAVPPVSSVQHVEMLNVDIWEAMMEVEKQKVAVLQKSFMEKMKNKGIEGEIKAIWNAKPGEAIVTVAKEEQIGLIVMATRGLNKIRRTVLGSVSDFVLHHVHCPVLIYRSEDTGELSSNELIPDPNFISSGGSRTSLHK